MNESVVVIPTYNERHNIENLLTEINSLNAGLDIIVVDDNSPDGTADAVKNFSSAHPDKSIHLITRPAKNGLGSAYLESFEWILGHTRYKKIFMMDADLSHNPRYLSTMIEALSDDKTDVVVGSRYITGGGISGWPFIRRCISRMGNFYARVVTGLKISDLTSGFIGIKREVLNSLLVPRLKAEGYGFLIELKYRTVRSGFFIKEIPIIFTDRKAGRSKISRRIILEAFFLVWQLKFSQKGIVNNIKSVSLLPLTYIYKILLAIDRFFKKSRRRKIAPALLSLRIVSIGNITWGGTGKTPMTIKTATEIYKIADISRRRITIVLRGYRSWKRENTPVEICADDMTDFSSEKIYTVGDEAAEIAYALYSSGLKNFVVITCPDRYQAIMRAQKKYGADLVIMDDGFQRLDVPRQLDVVCINAVRPFGNGMLIPSGILREPLEGLKRADAIMITNTDMVPAYQLDKVVENLGEIIKGSNGVVYKTHPELSCFLKLTPDGTLIQSEISSDSSMSFVGFSGLGSNESFKIFVEKNVAPLNAFYSFGDHHWYSAEDIRGLIEAHPGCMFLTTRKDIMRILPLIRRKELQLSPDDKIYAVVSEIRFNSAHEEASWQDLIKKRLSLTATEL